MITKLSKKLGSIVGWGTVLCLILSFSRSSIFLQDPGVDESLAWPALKKGEKIIRHTGFSLVFDTLHRQARWVAYALTPERTQGVEPRLNRFYPDPLLPSLTATDLDYRKSGFDRGHLVPAADMSWSQQALLESFYYSNVSPQQPAFNRGVWKKLEERVRRWAQTHALMYVVTGPVLSDTLSCIGLHQVSVPHYFFKALLVYSEDEKKCIGFILRNERASSSLSAFAVTIDSLELFTGIDFFPALPDTIENALERTLCLSCWQLD